MCTLVIALLGRSLTRDEIAERVRGYPPDEDSMRAQLIRDIAALEEEGVHVTVSQRRDGAWVYTLDEDGYYLPELGLTPEEDVALAAAAAAVDLGGGTVRSALLQLGGMIPDAPVDVAAVLPAPAVLERLWAARAERAIAMFTYNGEERAVEPWGLVCQRGWWYMVGFDRGRAARRVFRVDRIVGEVRTGSGGKFDVPGAFDAHGAVPVPWQLPGEEENMAEVLVDSVAASTAIAELGRDVQVDEREDGSVLLRFPVSHPDAFRAWALGLLDHAEVVGPPALRAHVVEWLAAMAK